MVTVRCHRLACGLVAARHAQGIAVGLVVSGSAEVVTAKAWKEGRAREVDWFAGRFLCYGVPVDREAGPVIALVIAVVVQFEATA